NRRQPIAFQERTCHRPQARPRIVKTQGHPAIGKAEPASDVGGDFIGVRRAVAVFGEVSKLRLKLLAGHIVKVKHRKCPGGIQAAAKYEPGKPSACEIQPAAKRAASLVEWDAGSVHLSPCEETPSRS